MVSARKRGAMLAVIVAIAAGSLVVTRKADAPVAPAGSSVPAGVVQQPAVKALLELPEVKEMSEQIDKSSAGAARGAIIVGDGEAKVVNGKTYLPYSFMESDAKISRRIQGFYVTADGKDILVDDIETGEAITLEEWRQR